MKIGITCYPTFGGSGVVATELGIALARDGHEVHFISYSHPIRLDSSDPDGGGLARTAGCDIGNAAFVLDGPSGPIEFRTGSGGYRVPACVIGADVGRVAQLLPGDRVRFASVSLEDARDAWRHAEEELAALETLDASEDDELRWAGSHE